MTDQFSLDHLAAVYYADLARCARDNPVIEPGMTVALYETPDFMVFTGYARILETTWSERWHEYIAKIILFENRQIFANCRTTCMQLVKLKSSMMRDCLRRVV